jgi:hypothetical protein
MVWWAFILAGLGVISYAIYYSYELKTKYHESLPTALFVGGGLAILFGIMYYNAYSKHSFGLYFFTGFLRSLTNIAFK